LFLLIGGKILSQNDSAASIVDSSQLSLRDSSFQLNNFKNFSFEKSKEFYQSWSDQFPSYFIMRFNSLPSEQPLELPLNKANEDWKFWLALFLLAFLAVIRFGFPKDFDELNQTLKSWGVNQQVIRDLGVGVPFGIVLLNIFSSIVISFYVFLLLQHFKVTLIEPSWLLMIFSFACVEAVLLLRYILLKTAEIIFPFRKELKLYNFYEIQVNRLSGVCLFPMLLLITFSTPAISSVALFGSFIIVGAMLLIRYTKGFTIGISYFSSHVIHFLLYLCALEIAPVLIIIRLLLNLGTIRVSL
jgi:Domain of unknown function (DUF4271)